MSKSTHVVIYEHFRRSSAMRVYICVLKTLNEFSTILENFLAASNRGGLYCAEASFSLNQCRKYFKCSFTLSIVKTLKKYLLINFQSLFTRPDKDFSRTWFSSGAKKDLGLPNQFRATTPLATSMQKLIKMNEP